MANSTNVMIDTQDFDHYDLALQSFLDGQLDAQSFLHTRLNLGVYTQRQEGMCMVRAKLPGGKLSVEQLNGFAHCLEKYSAIDELQLTTRQDIQFHYVPLGETPELQRELARFNIATREAGGNTIRNITACQLAGVCPAEHVNVQHYITLVSEYFVRHPLTQSLPRKFKISFSGCGSDCAQGMIHDLGVIASSKEGQVGFKLLVGGGLGAKPKIAMVLIDFVAEAELLPAIEAILVLHDKFSDRKRRTRNRIKFLVEKWGKEKFRHDFLIEFARTRSAFNSAKTPLTQWRTPQSSAQAFGANLLKPFKQAQSELFALPLYIKHGDLNSKQLRGLADLLTSEGLDDLRVNQEQNLSLFNVAENRLEDIKQQLAQLNITITNNSPSVVTCPGTTTCPLGITNSERIGQIIQSKGTRLNVRINGCTNNCAQSSTADVGFFGKGQRYHGTLVPSYKLQLGGSGRDGELLAFDGPQIPATRVDSALERITNSYNQDQQENESFYNWSRRKGADYFKELLYSLTQVRESELPFLIRDLGDRNVFQVESVGVGECAGAQLNPLEKLYLEAQYEAKLGQSFAIKFKYDEAIECLDDRLFLLSRALFLKLDVENNASDFAGQIQQLQHLGLVNYSKHGQITTLYSKIREFENNPDEQAYPLLSAEVDKWKKFIESIDLNLDKNKELHLALQG
ncbi:MAG: nitrite/sulfite reductase [Pseudomonadota bacterium]